MNFSNTHGNFVFPVQTGLGVDIFFLETKTLYSHHYTRSDSLYHRTLLHSLDI